MKRHKLKDDADNLIILKRRSAAYFRSIFRRRCIEGENKKLFQGADPHTIMSGA
jgi:hypothetical protein